MRSINALQSRAFGITCVHSENGRLVVRVTAAFSAGTYAVTFPDSKVTAVHEAPGGYPGGKKGDVLTVEFTLLGIPCLGLNGGPAFRHTEAFSFQIATEN